MFLRPDLLLLVQTRPNKCVNAFMEIVTFCPQ